VGYQASGTRGRRLLDGEERIKMHGEWIPVNARIASVPAFSVHADRSELLDWLGSAPSAPERVIAVHGDPDAMDSLAEAVRSRFDQTMLTPGDGQSILLD
jgi:metallo-beta-lactamase family protein